MTVISIIALIGWYVCVRIEMKQNQLDLRLTKLRIGATESRINDLEFQVKSLKGKLKKEHDRHLKTKQALNKHLRVHGT